MPPARPADAARSIAAQLREGMAQFAADPAFRTLTRADLQREDIFDQPRDLSERLSALPSFDGPDDLSEQMVAPEGLGPVTDHTRP